MMPLPPAESRMSNSGKSSTFTGETLGIPDLDSEKVDGEGTWECNAIVLDLADFEIGKKLGQGAFCQVFEAVQHKDTFAMKQPRRDLSRASYDLAVKDLRKEAVFLSALAPHNNIIKFYGHGENFILLERLSESFLSRYTSWQNESQQLPGNHTLFKMLQGIMPSVESRLLALWRARLSACRDLAAALEHLHSPMLGIPEQILIFRDLKPSNLYFDGDRLVLFDFGLAKFLPVSIANCSASQEEIDAFQPTPETGSTRYMAPECALGHFYDQSCDIYSFGILLWQISTLSTPFEGNSIQVHFDQVVVKEYRPPLPSPSPVLPVRWHNTLTSLIESAWAHRSIERLSAAAARALLENILSNIPSS